MISTLVKNRKDHLLGLLWGTIVGEAVGLPVKGQPREFRKIYPIETITGWGSFNLPPGYWNDKGGVLLASLAGISNEDSSILEELKSWYYDGKYTPEGKIYDISQSLKNTIEGYASGMDFDKSIINEEVENGSDKIGFSILPLIHFLVNGKISLTNSELEQLFQTFHQTPVFILSSYLVAYVNYYLLNKNSKADIQNELLRFLTKIEEVKKFKKAVKLLLPRIEMIHKKDWDEYNPVDSYYDVIEIALKALIQGENFEETVLIPVNLGGPTDTMASLAGMWAGNLYGFSSIPMGWLEYIPQKDMIQSITGKFLNLLKNESLIVERFQASVRI